MRSFLLTITFLGVLMGSSLPKYHTNTLENGLEVFVIPMKNGSGVITTDIFYKVGSRNEEMGRSGIAHMLEHLNFKSTKNLKAGEFDEIVKGFGGVNNASTGFDYTHYFIKSSNENLEKSLELFSELMQNLNLKDEEFQTERDVVAEERRWRTDNNPMGLLYFSLFNHVFVYHPYHWTPIGFMSDIQNWTIDNIRDFHKQFYQPKNAMIVVAGDIDEDKVFSLSKKYFENIKNCCDIPKVYQVEPEQKGAKRLEIKKESEVEIISIAYRIPNFEHEDQTALSVISELLSSGKSSRFQEVLVDKKSLVNQIYAYNMEAKDESVFLIMAVCNPGVKAEVVEEEILKQLDELKKGNIQQEELEKIKINTKADFIYSLENSSSLANMFGSYLARGNLNPLLEYENNLNKTTIKEIINISKKYLKKEKSTVVILRKGEE